MNCCARCSGQLPVFAVFCPHCAQIHEPDFGQLINMTIGGRYRIYRRLGQGGLSTIFAATDIETDSVVAIKISDPAQLVHREMSYAIDSNQARGFWDEMLERMRREAETLTHIDHPNIVRFHGTELINDDLRYVAMEFLRGRTLRDEMDRGGGIDPAKAISIALEITSALSEVHARGIVHRDINPRNIMIAECGSQESLSPETPAPQSAIRNPQSAIKLIDFGIAKFPQPPGAPPFTQHSTLAGTVAYASPEQCASQPVDHRSDIYSLGVVLYEMATGQRPFNGRTPTEIALKQIQSEPKPPRSINSAISASLEKTILRALAKNPIERQQSVQEMAGELRTPSNQIFIPLMASEPDADVHSAFALGGNEITNGDEAGEMAEPELKLVRRRRRRFAVAAATLLITAAASALLFGWPSISSRLKFPNAVGSADSDASSSSTAAPLIGSDADSLELAASMSSQNNGAAAANTATQMTPGAAQPTQRVNSAAANIAVNNKAAKRTAIPPTPSPAPAPIPPGARPQMPPAPSPTIEIARAPQSDSDPDLAQAPGKEQDGGEWRRETDSANNRSSNGDVIRDSEPDDDHDSNRNRNNGAGGYRRLPAPSSRDDRDDDDDDYSERIGPELIQWSGRVRGEREITIEMPGGPGKVEIPRVYRDRVGIVEPPSARNNWRCAVLRVFGRGGVSIVIRWWPAARNAVRYTARR
ncbi:MAG: serine/threonine protein kinase [Blastocatellales bacterium]